MPFLRCFRRNVSPASNFFHPTKTSASKIKHALSTIAVIALATLPCLAQDQPQPDNQDSQSNPSQSQDQAAIKLAPITIPAGTNIALVLTHPIQSRYIHRGDDIYAQVTDPVDSGNQVAIPPGTFVQGTVDRLDRKGGRAELHLQSMSITFPDGYVAPIVGPITLTTGDGYALKDPGQGRGAGAILAPVAGVGLGALIGHSVGSSQSTLTSSIPAGCTGPPPGCLTSSMPIPGSSFKTTAIGAAVGGFAGMAVSITLLVSSHHFFLDVGAPVEMTLQQPITLQGNEVAEAVKQAAQHPMLPQPIAPRSVPPPVPPSNPDHGTCYTPGTPGTPPTVIPGVPGPDGIPGPPTIIPGIPPTPGTPYPCP